MIGPGAAVLHCPVVKPVDTAAVARFCRRFAKVTTVENHSVIGGLAAAVAEVVTHEGIGTRIERLGIPDRWAPAGSLDYIRGELGLDAAGIVRAAR